MYHNEHSFINVKLIVTPVSITKLQRPVEGDICPIAKSTMTALFL